MAEIIYRDDKEQQKVQAFITEKKIAWESQELQNSINAERKGESYTEKPFPEIPEAEALAAVRDGWKSKLEIAFEKKRKREEAKGIKWVK